MPMALLSPAPDSVCAADPFGERVACNMELQRTVLGGRFRFRSDSEALLRLVEAAYGGLPQQALPAGAPEFHIELRLVPPRNDIAGEPPPVRQQAGAGLLCGVMDACNYALLDAQGRRALVVASRDMLGHPYHLRYELIEFAVFTLATRGGGLVPLHGACVGRDGRGVLLLGASGAGKSTLALHSLLGGLDFLAEDAVFVRPDNLLAHGVPNYLHLRPDAPQHIDDRAVRDWLARSPRIRRRSGVEKIEADLRHGVGRLADSALALVGAVFVSPEMAAEGTPSLRSLAPDTIPARLAADQAYAAGQPGWHAFVRELAARGVHELRRGPRPRASVEALHQLLA